MDDDLHRRPDASRRLRLNTLIRLRWLAVIGQSTTVLIVAYGLIFPLPVIPCLALIACSACLNLLLTFRYPATHRLTPTAALVILTFDALQLTGLLYLTGGLANPFSVLLVVPVIVSATSLPLRLTAVLGAVVVAAASLLALYHLPLPWFEGSRVPIPFVYIAGVWVAVVSTIAFTAIYAWRVAEEARLLAAALAATELVLQREQHLSALDGMAAAAAHELGTPLATIALVAREMERAFGHDERFREDVTLLRSQSERCREILKRLTSLSSEGEAHLARMPLTSLVEEAIAPHRDLGIAIQINPVLPDGPEPIGRRNPGVIYGLGNVIENAVDFARETVWIRLHWDDYRVALSIMDDGPGFSADILDRIGEPYATKRPERTTPRGGGGLGLGLFIAKTLLERSGASIVFRNANEPGMGALVEIAWPREVFVDSAVQNLSG